MPWSVKKIDGQFCVVKEGETSAISGGCHDVRSEAAAHVRALYSSEAEAAVSKIYEEEAPEIEDFDEFGQDGDTFEFSDTMKEYAWEGPIVFENVYTGDNRVFKADSINWQEETLPWAFRWQKSSGQGHAGSVPVGRVDRLARMEDGSIHGYGVVIPELSDEAAEYLRMLQTGVGGGVSVDGDSAQFEIQEQEGSQPKVEFSSMRLRALSAVDIPAFNGARIHLIGTKTEDEATEPLAVEDTDVEIKVESEVDPAIIAAAIKEELAKKVFPFEKKDEEDEDSEAKDEDSEDEEDEDSEKEDSKSKDKDGKKFPWDKKDEMSIIREELAKKKAKKKKKAYGWHFDSALVAAAIPTLPSTDAFIDPEFDGPTALTVTEDGRVFGHLALFNTCHIGFPGTCVKPPKGSKYQYFHTGQLETAEGDLVDVGKLTFKTGHADMNATPRIAADHYDNTGTVAADVRAGEDKFGIWVVGALRPHLSDEDIRAFRCAPLSGDWRRIAGKLELVGALGVNTPGFPVPRVRALVASGETETLFTFLEDDDEEFNITDEELDMRLDKRAELASKVMDSLGEQAPEGEIKNEVPDAPSKKDIEAVVENYTKSQLFADLKDLRELLDDPDEKMTAKVRKSLEDIYSVAIKVDDTGKRFSGDGYDLDIIENSGLDYDEWEEQLTFSGLDVHEFYNTCHGEDGKFCQGKDGPGRVRDNIVKGRHKGPPGEAHGTGGKSKEDHQAEHDAYNASKGKGSGGSGGSGNSSNNNNNNNNSGGGGIDSRLYENHLITRKRAKGWAAAATIAAAALNSPVAPFLQGLATASGVAILGNPAILGLLFTTGVAYAAKNTIASRKHRADYNRQVQKKLARDKLNDRQRREQERLRVSI